MAPTFEYEARTRDGKKITGTREEESVSDVARSLKNKGYYVLDINKKRSRKSLSDLISFGGGVGMKDLAIFSQQFSAIINAGISLVDALNIITAQIDNQTLKEALESIRQDVETGSSLAEAADSHPEVFPELYVQLLRAGEMGGVLDKVLNNLAEHYEKQQRLKNMVKSALYYPVVIVCVAVLVVIFLITFVVPTFVEMFADFGAQLPLPTRILLGVSGIFQSYWWLMMLVILGVIYGLSKYKQTPEGQMKFDRLILKMPVLGDMLKKIYISRFSSTLAMMLDSGVDLLESLALVEDVVGNKVLAQILVDTRIQVREGVNITEPLKKSDFFPPMVIQMMQVGEETGDLDSMLQKISSFYDNEVENSVDGVVSLIEPVMIVFLAVVVGSIVISILMPMFEMFEHF